MKVRLIPDEVEIPDAVGEALLEYPEDSHWKWVTWLLPNGRRAPERYEIVVPLRWERVPDDHGH